MNAPHSPAPDPDELASALVDGLLSAEEADRARQDPAVNRRVEEIRRVRSMLRTAPPPVPGAADRAVAAAVASFAPTARHLRALDASGPRPPGKPGAGRGARWLAAAAVLVVVLAAAVGLSSRSGDEDLASEGDAATTMDQAPAAPDAAAESQDDSFDGDEELDSGAAAASPPPVVYLGIVDNPDELRQNMVAAAAAASGAEREAPATDEEAVSPGDGLDCVGLRPEGDPERGTTLVVGSAIYREEPIVVHVYELDGKQRLVATNSSCVDVVDVSYPA